MKRLLRQLDERLGLTPVWQVLQQTRPSTYVSPWDAPPISPGRIAFVLILLLLSSGLGLTLFYNPTAEHAAASLANLHQNQPFGWLLHNVHRWSALFLFIFVILHALRVWLERAYRYPRDINWLVGLSLLLLVIFLGGTGYILRWDIKAFGLLDLVISNFSDLPLVQSSLVSLILGGSELDVVPLYRGYATHIWFLPTVLLVTLAVHLTVVWRQGITASATWMAIKERIPISRW